MDDSKVRNRDSTKQKDDKPEEEKITEGYQQLDTRTLTHGFVNLSLLSANGGQLKLILKKGDYGTYDEVLLVMVATSILLQAAVVVLLAIKKTNKIEGAAKSRQSNNTYNIWATLIGALITGLNIIISSLIE